MNDTAYVITNSHNDTHKQSCAEMLAQTINFENQSADQQLRRFIDYTLIDVGIPLICVFGICGNLLSLLILTRKQLQNTMDHMEKAAHSGLVSLALSDLLFCIVTFPTSFVNEKKVYYHEITPMLHFETFSVAPVATFLFSSTWLTVTMATGRYMAICHPLHARGFIDPKHTKIIIIVVFVFSVLFNLPYYWSSSIKEDQCGHCVCYELVQGRLHTIPHFYYIYKIIWAILGTFLPLIILAICNTCLIRALQRSARMRRMYGANHQQDSGHHLTPTLIAIVVLFIILVCPSEILKFTREMIQTSGDHHKYISYLIAKDVFNFMQVVNFAINFILYCAINVHFRKTIKNALCRAPRRAEMVRTTMHNVTVTCNMSDLETEM